MPLPASRFRVHRTLAAASGRSAAAEPGLMAGAVRGLVATPWFAAATGFVVAAGLWIYSPHAELKFPSSAVGTVPCTAQGCGDYSRPGWRRARDDQGPAHHALRDGSGQGGRAERR